MISDSEDYYSDSMMDEQDMMTRNSNGFCTEAEKRAHHNALERKRRDHIKDSFMDLRDAIPTIRGKKTSRAEILTKALEFIRSKMDQLANERKFIDRMRRENHLIAEKLRALESESDNENYHKLFGERAAGAECDELATTEPGEASDALDDSPDTAAAKADLENNLIPKVSRVLELYNCPAAAVDETSDNDETKSNRGRVAVAVTVTQLPNRKRADTHDADDDDDNDVDNNQNDDSSVVDFSNRSSVKSRSLAQPESNLANRTSVEPLNPAVRNKRFKCNNNV